MVEGSHLAAVVEGFRLVSLHVDTIANAIQHVEQTGLWFFSGRFAIKTFTVFEGVCEGAP